MAKMTAKQKLFCDEYLIDLNATRAAIRAGYSEKKAYSQGQRMLKNVECQNYISERMAEKESKLIATQDEVLQYLTSVMRGESKAAVLARTYDGSETVIEKPPDEKERLSAAEKLGKRYSLFTDKVEADIDTELTINIRRV